MSEEEKKKFWEKMQKIGDSRPTSVEGEEKSLAEFFEVKLPEKKGEMSGLFDGKEELLENMMRATLNTQIAALEKTLEKFREAATAESFEDCITKLQEAMAMDSAAEEAVKLFAMLKLAMGEHPEEELTAILTEPDGKRKMMERVIDVMGEIPDPFSKTQGFSPENLAELMEAGLRGDWRAEWVGLVKGFFIGRGAHGATQEEVFEHGMIGHPPLPSDECRETPEVRQKNALKILKQFGFIKERAGRYYYALDVPEGEDDDGE